jgi:predicted GH43/DUF377 family glycosyl hydrolase
MCRNKQVSRFLPTFFSLLVGLSLLFVSPHIAKSSPISPDKALDGSLFLLDEPARTLPGDWDGRGVRKPVIIKESSNYLMWYEGLDYWEVSRVGLATSSDGIYWTKYLGNPVLDRGPAEWETTDEIAPFVMFHEGQYKMWYEGSDGTIRQLGYATSPDGIIWTKYDSNPVLAAGPETYDELGAAHGAVLYEDSTYKLWYHAIADSNITIAYATSLDGINWTKEGPVLWIDSGSWEDWGIWGPSVLKVEDEYWMWYAGGALIHPSIGFATSDDGVTWTKHEGNPVIRIADNEIGDPTVILDGETFKMWFNNFTDGQIYYTESENGVNWDTPTAVLFPGLMDPMVGYHDGDEGDVRYPTCSAFGWVIDPDDVTRDVTVQVLVDGELVEELLANEYRPDPDPLICPEGTCGYSIQLGDKISLNQPHQVTVQAYDEESEDWWGLEGTPKTLTCQGGRLYLPVMTRMERTGDPLSVFESGSQTFPASTPFHIAHGWWLDFPAENEELFTFELEVDGVYATLDFIETTIDESTDPPTIYKYFVFNFPEGMTGTHIFEGHWLSPCYATQDDCSDPLEILEMTRSHLKNSV